jgi:hypothetical protein
MSSPQQTIDRLGGLLSLVCAIHCAAVPVLVVVAALGLPIADGLLALEDERIELGFSLTAIVFVAVSVGLHWRHPNRSSMLASFGLGLALLIGPRLVEAPEWIAHVAVIAGALLLAWTHRRGYRAGVERRRSGGRDHCGDAPAGLDRATSRPGLDRATSSPGLDRATSSPGLLP